MSKSLQSSYNDLLSPEKDSFSPFKRRAVNRRIGPKKVWIDKWTGNKRKRVNVC